MRGDLVLHLHGLDHAHQRALLHVGAGLDGDLENGALDRRGQRIPAPTATTGGALAAPGGPASPGRRSGTGTVDRRAPAAGGPITLTSKRLPETSTV